MRWGRHRATRPRRNATASASRSGSVAVEIVLVDRPRSSVTLCARTSSGRRYRIPSAATHVASSSGSEIERSRLYIHRRGPPGLSWTSRSHGASACSRSHTWPDQVAAAEAGDRRAGGASRCRRPTGRSRPWKCARSSSTSRRKTVASTSLCGRATPRERLDRPASRDPPRPGESVEQLRRVASGSRSCPRPPEALELPLLRLAPRVGHRIDWPSALAASSTAIAALPFSRSRIGFTSTSSSEPTSPDSARSSHARCASRYVRPPFTGVPTPGAISGSSASRSSETWTKPGPGRPVDRLAHRSLDPDPVDLGHRDRADPALPDQRRARPGRASARRRARRARGRPRAARGRRARIASPASPSAAASGIPCTFPDGLVVGRVEIAVRVDPDHASGLAGGGAEPRQRPERDRVVAAEDERDSAVCDDVADDRRPAVRTPRGSRGGTARARPRPTSASGSGVVTFPRSTTRQPKDDSRSSSPA